MTESSLWLSLVSTMEKIQLLFALEKKDSPKQDFFDPTNAWTPQISLVLPTYACLPSHPPTPDIVPRTVAFCVEMIHHLAIDWTREKEGERDYPGTCKRDEDIGYTLFNKTFTSGSN